MGAVRSKAFGGELLLCPVQGLEGMLPDMGDDPVAMGWLVGWLVGW